MSIVSSTARRAALAITTGVHDSTRGIHRARYRSLTKTHLDHNLVGQSIADHAD
jgi:hypothetical protein